MTHFRLRHRVMGGHVHVTVWSAPSELVTHAQNGTLMFTAQEWEDFRWAIRSRREFSVEEAWTRPETEAQWNS